ncbi:YesL family protein [Alteribacillus sp. HJP-4]|uniref:YesL family protein n=1 Tax=Alteribacillus sp. HJP-4 TaxID=2775394 RepID=UPI0035CD2830
MNSFAFGILRIPEWILKFVYVNALWILFSCAGALLFGIFPATAALFVVVRKWIHGNTEFPIFAVFWKIWKQDFLKSNALGYLLAVTGFSLYVYYELIQLLNGSALQILSIIFFMAAFLFVITLFYAFPVFAHYESGVLTMIKTSFFMMIVSPLSTLMMLAGIAILYFTMVSFPGLFVLFGASGLAFLFMLSAEIAFTAITRRKNKLLKKTESNQH